MSPEIWIGMGSNLGDRAANLEAGLKGLSEIADVICTSSIFETEPWGKSDQPTYLNAVCAVVTDIEEPLDFLDVLKEIEERAGPRRRDTRWGPRYLDLDILFWGTTVVNHDRLTIPHRDIAKRRFVLESLAEIASELHHPIFGCTIGELLERCSDKTEVRRWGSLPIGKNVPLQSDGKS